MNECKNFIKSEILKSTPTGEIISKVREKYGVTYNAAQKRVHSVRSAMQQQHEASTSTNVNNNRKVGDVVTNYVETDNVKGTTVFDGKICLPINGLVKEADILKAYQLDISEWNVLSFRMSNWEAQKDGDIIGMQAFRLVVTPRRANEGILPTDWDEYFKNASIPQIPVPDLFPLYEGEDGYIGEIDLDDVHHGLLASEDECGEKYNLEISERDCITAASELIRKIRTFNLPIKKILLVSNGDYVHIDSESGTTTKGTEQDTSGRPTEIIDVASRTLETLILMFEQIAEVEYIYIPGNHDTNFGYGVANAMYYRFKGHNRVTIDSKPSFHKHRRFGHTVIGWTHGDTNKKNLDGLLMNMVENISDEDYKCLHVGHTHCDAMYISNDGTVIEHRESLCPSSAWEEKQGFPKKNPVVRIEDEDGNITKKRRRTICMYLWNEEGTDPDRIYGSTC